MEGNTKGIKDSKREFIGDNAIKNDAEKQRLFEIILK